MTMTPMLACYIKCVGSSHWQPLKIGATVKIKPGDICSLLPDKSWFKVTAALSNTAMNDNDANCKRKATISSEDEPPDKKLRPSNSESVETIYSQRKDVLDGWEAKEVASVDLDCEVDNKNSSQNPQSNESTKDTSGPEIQHNLCSEKRMSEDTPIDAQKMKETRENPVPINVSANNDPPSSENSGTNNGEDSSGIGKKIKWDCGRHFSDQTDQATAEITIVENGGNSNAGPDNTQNIEVTIDLSEEPPMRNKCAYGSRCYRRNPDHKTEFSHPGDEDYDIPDTRPECPYGIRCYRKNPQHKRDFKHTNIRPSRAQTPLRGRLSDATSGTEQSSAEDDESVDESDYDPSYYEGTSDEYRSDLDGLSDFDAISDYDDK